MLSLQNEILEELKKSISSTEFERYLKNLKFNSKSSSPNFIVYNVSNEIKAKFIQTIYGEKFQNLYEKKTGIRPTIKITSKSKIDKKDNKTDNVVKPKSTILSESYSFENFIVGESNQFAYACSKSVAQNPGGEYNPLFIYGPSGLGKTHLLQSIGNFCNAKGKSVICVTSEQFANDLSFNIKNNSTDKFKEKYRNCDVLLIDDIQFLVSRDKAREELFYTFNELQNKHCQIVLTNDRPPKFLKNFEDRLMTRFESGLIADITPPNLETKIAIIQKKCEENNLFLNREVVEYIAVNMGDNIREIEGAINNLRVYSTMMQIPPNLEFTKNILQDRIKERKDNINLDDILDVIAKELNVKPSLIKSKSRVKNVVEARRIAIYLAKNLAGNSMHKIATYFNLKDHSAVSHNIKKINETIESGNEYMKIKIDELKSKITKKEKNV